MSKIFLLLCVFVVMSGCATFEDRLAKRYGAESMIKENSKVAPVDLFTILDPENRAAQIANGTGIAYSKLSDDMKLNLSFEAFYKYDEKERRRNRVQDRLRAASNDRCREFKQKLKLQRDAAELIPGAIAITTAGLGAILTPVSTVRALSGSAAIVSGIRAETLQTIYAYKTIQVVTEGINLRRKKISAKIIKERDKGIDKYTVEAAVSDAIEYHAACSLLAGLEEIATAVKIADIVDVTDYLIKPPKPESQGTESR